MTESILQYQDQELAREGYIQELQKLLTEHQEDPKETTMSVEELFIKIDRTVPPHILRFRTTVQNVPGFIADVLTCAYSDCNGEMKVGLTDFCHLSAMMFLKQKRTVFTTFTVE